MSEADHAGGVPGPNVVDVAWRVVRSVGRRVSAELAAEGFTDLRPAHNAVLYWLCAGMTRVTDIAQQFGVTRQAVSLLVDQLQATGYVERTIDPADRRVRVVLLTDRGNAAAACVNRAYSDINDRWAGVVGLDHVLDCCDMLEKMVEVVVHVPAGRPD